MTNQELILKIIEIAYEHWIITCLFGIFILPWNTLNINNKEPDDGK